MVLRIVLILILQESELIQEKYRKNTEGDFLVYSATFL